MQRLRMPLLRGKHFAALAHRKNSLGSLCAPYEALVTAAILLGCPWVEKRV